MGSILAVFSEFVIFILSCIGIISVYNSIYNKIGRFVKPDLYVIQKKSDQISDAVCRQTEFAGNAVSEKKENGCLKIVPYRHNLRF